MEMKSINYIAFEGIDGVGKTALSKMFAKRNGYEYRYEPDGEGEVTSTLRKFALSKEYADEVNPVARMYLMIANRAISIPKLPERVVSDRSFVSGMAYEGMENDLGMKEWIHIASKAITRFPDLIVYVMADNTKEQRGIDESDIYDARGDDFRKRLNEQFLKVLRYAPDLGSPVIFFKNEFSDSDNAVEKNCERLESLISQLYT